MDFYCSYGPWHLELEVCIVWDSHELDKAWSAEYSMVLGFPVYYFKVNEFYSVVPSFSKYHFVSDLSE